MAKGRLWFHLGAVKVVVWRNRSIIGKPGRIFVMRLTVLLRSCQGGGPGYLFQNLIGTAEGYFLSSRIAHDSPITCLSAYDAFGP